MESTKLLKGLFNRLNNGSHFVDGAGGGYTQLTPHLSLVVAILYMMVADGEISDQESSQLQSVIGSNENVLKRALHYVERTDIEQFLKDVPAVLDSQDSLCVLMNVCDSIMADGQLAEVETKLFERLTSALGHNKKTFKSYFKTISIKNKKSVLGSFENVSISEQLSPQMALAASLLYMMSADGSMAEEEIGQLNVVIGNSKGLLQAGLKYVRSIKFQQFIKEATVIINPAQQLCILTNVCDSMMSDGEVAAVELDLFRRMLTAFGFSEEKFQPYYNILLRKNEKPVEIDNEDSYAGVIPARIKKNEEEGVAYDRKMSRSDNNIKAPGELGNSADEQDEINARTEQSELGIIINRKMHDNLSKMSADIQSGSGIQEITDNANSQSSDGETSLRAYNDSRTLTDANQIQDSVHYLDNDETKESIHYLENENAKSSVHYLDKDETNSDADHEFNKLNGSNKNALQPQNTHSNGSGPAKQRAIKDKHQLISGKRPPRREKSPSDLRIIANSELFVEQTPLRARMTVVKTRTDEINQTLDRLETVSESHFTKRSQVLNTITFSPAPALAYVKVDSVLVNNPIAIIINEEFPMAANNSVLENSASATCLAGFDKLKIKIAGLFTAMIIAHGFSSFGESVAQIDLIKNQNLITNTNLSLQALAVQQSFYQLAADDLDFSLSKKDFYSSEQQELVKNKLAAYLLKIKTQESAPESLDGKKELLAARKNHQQLEAVDESKLQWFSLSKAILLFGIGLSLCGFFFRSRIVFYSASLSAALGTVFTLNAYFLFF